MDPDATPAEDALARLRDDVAVRVMGWHLEDVAWASGEDVALWHRADGTPVMPRAAWRPDEDERHCARVVEHLVGEGLVLHLEAAAGRARARFSGPGETGGPEAEAISRRLAIARAALLARH